MFNIIKTIVNLFGNTPVVEQEEWTSPHGVDPLAHLVGDEPIHGKPLPPTMDESTANEIDVEAYLHIRSLLDQYKR